MDSRLLKNFFIFLALALLSLPEVLLGNFSWPLPWLFPLTLYFSVSCSWRTGVVIAIAAGAWFDLLYGRNFPITLWALLVLVLVGASFQRKGKTDRFSELVMPAFLALLAGELVMAAGSWPARPDFARIIDLAGLAVTRSVLGTAIFIGLAWLLDRLAGRLGIPLSIVSLQPGRGRRGIPGRRR